jgi:hypothetical protein
MAEAALGQIDQGASEHERGETEMSHGAAQPKPPQLARGALCRARRRRQVLLSVRVNSRGSRRKRAYGGQGLVGLLAPQPDGPSRAAIDAGANVLNWSPTVSGDTNSFGTRIYALVASGNTIYLGGSFTAVGGQTHDCLAAVDTSGNVLTWNPGVHVSTGVDVRALAVNGSTIYAAGDFTSIGSQSRNGLAAISSSGSVLGWNPNPNTLAYVLAISGSTLYAGGGFTTIGGQSRTALAALDGTSGTALSWDPVVADALYNSPVVSALAISGDTVYIGGQFTSVSGQPRAGLAAIGTDGILQ